MSKYPNFKFTIRGTPWLCDYWSDHQHVDAKKRFDDCINRYYQERLEVKSEIAKMKEKFSLIIIDEKE